MTDLLTKGVVGVRGFEPSQNAEQGHAGAASTEHTLGADPQAPPVSPDSSRYSSQSLPDYAAHSHQWWRHRCREAWQHIRDMQTDTPAPAWKPILTAPKDGTGILVAVEGMKGRFEIVWWRKTEGDYGYWFDGYRTYSDSVFSHWMPLPESPE